MTLKCTWNGCFSTFVCKSTLKRHIRCVHEKDRSYVCSVAECGAAFGTSSDFKRHNLSVHIKERNYKCSRCTKTFALQNALHRHVQVVHGTRTEIAHKTICVEKPSFICADCGFQFARKDVLIQHISDKHSYNEYFKCHDCGLKFVRKRVLKKHIFAKHLKKGLAVRVQNSRIRCIQCERSFQRVYLLRDHYVEDHNVDLDVQTLEFSSIKEFLAWKKNVEVSTITRFIARNRSKNLNVYVCHRSGIQRIKSHNRKRAPLLRGSKKLNGVCPASITLRTCMNKNDTSYVATFIKTHLGHFANFRDEMKFTFLHKDDRESLCALLAAGIPKRQILDDQLESSDTLLCDFMDANVTRSDCDLLNNKDLHQHRQNLLKKFTDLIDKVETWEQYDCANRYAKQMEASFHASSMEVPYLQRNLKKKKKS